VDELSYTFLRQNFDRLEFSNVKLKEAPTSTGALPLIVTAFGGQLIQLASTCTNDSPRPLGPDDANIGNIKQCFNITRYTLRGAANTETDIGNLFQIWNYHCDLLNAFDLYLQELNMFVSYSFLVDTLQPLDFSYLTTTGVSMAGPALFQTENNLLISSFTGGVIYESQVPGGSNSTVLQDFEMVIENRVISSQGTD
jgi:hypothetical protein